MCRNITFSSFTLTLLYLAACFPIIVSGFVTTTNSQYHNSAIRQRSPTTNRRHEESHPWGSSKLTSKAFDISAATTCTARTTRTSRLAVHKTSSSATASLSSSPSQQQLHRLTPLEVFCTSKIDSWYTQSLTLKCPFMKRRMADLLDGMDMVMRFLIIRHKSLEFIGPPPGCRCSKTMSHIKYTNLPIEDLLEYIRVDWVGRSSSGSSSSSKSNKQHRGYYITGRLTTSIYRDDCYFDGPDPDMPVKGLRKYLNAASQLFDHKTSTAELLNLQIVNDTTIEAKWKLQGVLHLPWKPTLPTWTGTTTYHLDEQGLIYLHKETWDISVLQAFVQTLFPELAQLFWDQEEVTASIIARRKAAMR